MMLLVSKHIKIAEKYAQFRIGVALPINLNQTISTLKRLAVKFQMELGQLKSPRLKPDFQRIKP
jgi:hypothetical protein